MVKEFPVHFSEVSIRTKNIIDFNNAELALPGDCSNPLTQFVLPVQPETDGFFEKVDLPHCSKVGTKKRETSSPFFPTKNKSILIACAYQLKVQFYNTSVVREYKLVGKMLH